jgi:hypothetical protein
VQIPFAKLEYLFKLIDEKKLKPAFFDANTNTIKKI